MQQSNLITKLLDRVWDRSTIHDRRSTPTTIMNSSQDNGYNQVTAGNCYDEHASMQYAVGAGELIGPCNVHSQKRLSPQDVMNGIEHIMLDICGFLTTGQLPILSNGTMRKQFTLSQARSFTSIVMVYSFVHSLLGSNRTTTTREVYYFYVTHFTSQRECDAAILDAANLLGVPRVSMGLYASPKGWYCGCIEIIRNGNITDATSLSSVQGLPITREWIDVSESRNNEDEFSIRSNAKCVLVIEKEGVYIRLSEDRFFERYPCILVTGKGFPDLATRALVHRLSQQLQIPVCGLCDCNPFGFGVLHTFELGSRRMGVDGGNRYGMPVRWVGLLPSYVQELYSQLPRDVYQRLTDIDKRRLDKLSDECHPFHCNHMDAEKRLDELHLMQSMGYKVELEALNWLGMDYMGDWIEEILVDQLGAMDM